MSIVRRVTPVLLVVIGLLLIRAGAAGPGRGPGPATAAATSTPRTRYPREDHSVTADLQVELRE